MVLMPCASCSRHISIRDEVCRFCRAAVISAGVLLGGCDAGVKPQHPEQAQKRTDARLRGVIKDRAGTPLAAATVHLYKPGGAPVQGGTTTTDAEGRYELDQIAPGTYELAVDYYKPGSYGDEMRGNHVESLALVAEDKRLDLTVDVRRLHVAPPYGAPPARRRSI